MNITAASSCKSSLAFEVEVLHMANFMMPHLSFTHDVCSMLVQFPALPNVVELYLGNMLVAVT